jgi:hypothetical protein
MRAVSRGKRIEHKSKFRAKSGTCRLERPRSLLKYCFIECLHLPTTLPPFSIHSLEGRDKKSSSRNYRTIKIGQQPALKQSPSALRTRSQHKLSTWCDLLAIVKFRSRPLLSRAISASWASPRSKLFVGQGANWHSSVKFLAESERLFSSCSEFKKGEIRARRASPVVS